MTTQVQRHFSLPERLMSFSCWHKAKRAIAICLRLQKRYRTGVKRKALSKSEEFHGGASKTTQYIPVNVQELQEAEREIIKSVQRDEFEEEISSLLPVNSSPCTQDHTSDRVVKKTSVLSQLDPFLDGHGILRIGGRLKHADISSAAKHPVILPKKGPVTSLIIAHCHHAVEHQGRGITHNHVRSSGYWIIGGVSVISDHIRSCIICRRLRGSVEEQKMADLPEDRVLPAPPFTYCAVDYFGPWYVKERRCQLKRYGVLFTCMSSRAVHLEVANSMTADSFISAYRRFVGRRGPIHQIRSDQGTNFVGARNELQQALSELDHDRIRQELLKRNCDWVDCKMNVPHASHMGGSWERQIKTVRNVLSALLMHHGSQLDDEALRTFMIEAESIVNCRPLAVNDLTSPDCLEPLSPNQLLTLKSHVVLPPPGTFQREDLYSKKRWRRVQYLANEFWQKWKAEFLQSLQARQKWVKPTRNLKVDDVVILKDESLPRNNWQLARVVQVYPSEDGLVRKVKVAVGNSSLDETGKAKKPTTYLDRPVQKLILLVPSDNV